MGSCLRLSTCFSGGSPISINRIGGALVCHYSDRTKINHEKHRYCTEDGHECHNAGAAGHCSSALTHSDATGSLASLARMEAADEVQMKGLGCALRSLR